MKAWKALLPPLIGIGIALLPAPAGLAPHAWHYFALFAAVIVALVLEPLPGGAVGLLGLTVAVILARFVLFSPDQLAKPGFSAPNAALAWALSGFSNPTVWLIFGAFMFALAYEKTGLGRRIALALVKRMGRSTLNLGYAVLGADLLLAPFTPSNTARSGGHHLPGHQPPAAPVRFEAQRPFHAPDRHLPHVGGDRHHLRDQHPLHDRPGPQRARGGTGAEDGPRGPPVAQVAVRGPPGLPPAPGRGAAADLLAGTALGEGRPRGAPMGDRGTGQDGRADPEGDPPPGLRGRRPGALDLRGRLHQPHHRGPAGHRHDAGDPGDHLGRDDAEQGRLEHLRLVRDPGGAGRRPFPGGLHPLVRHHRGLRTWAGFPSSRPWWPCCW